MRAFTTLISVVTLTCLITPAIAADNFTGSYTGRLGSAEAAMTLRSDGTVVSGSIKHAAGADIDLRGELQEGKVIGAAMSRQGAAFFEAWRELGGVIVVIREPGTVTGQAVETRGEFVLSAEPAATADHQSTASVSRDAALVGTWLTRHLVTNGDMVLPVLTKMILDADGSYSESDDLNISSKSGQWRNEGGQIYYMAEGAEAWSSVGQYLLNGDRLITALPDTPPLVWLRSTD